MALLTIDFLVGDINVNKRDTSLLYSYFFINQLNLFFMKKKNFLFGLCVLLTTMTFMFANNQSSVEAITMDSVEALSDGNGSGDPVYLGDQSVYLINNCVYFVDKQNRTMAAGCKPKSGYVCVMDSTQAPSSPWKQFWTGLIPAIVSAISSWLSSL